MSANYSIDGIAQAIHSDTYKRDALFRAMINDIVNQHITSNNCTGVYGYMYGKPYILHVVDKDTDVRKPDEIIFIEKSKLKPTANNDAFIYRWGFPGPDCNKYSIEDYGFTWAFRKEDIRCPICYTCDTRKRLHMCNGRSGAFKYCFRKSGSTNGLEATITPFNKPDDLFVNKVDYIQALDKNSLILDETNYGSDGFMCLMYGKFKGDIDTADDYPVGYITKLWGKVNVSKNIEDV